MNNPTPHKPTKRRNIVRWMRARLRRLWLDLDKGRATPRQEARCYQLQGQIASAEVLGVAAVREGGAK